MKSAQDSSRDLTTARIIDPHTYRPTNLSGIVLAGGRSKRLATPTPKPLLPLGGKILLARVADTLKTLCHELILVIRPDQSDDIPDLGIALGMHVVTDPQGESGPLAAMSVGLQAATTPLAFVVGADHPFLSRPLIIEMTRLAHAQSTRDSEQAAVLNAVIPREGGRYNPLHAVYPVREWRDLTRQAVEQQHMDSPQVLLERTVERGEPPILVMTSDEIERIDPRKLSLIDIDNLEDLGTAKRIIDEQMHRIRPDIKRANI